MCQPWALYGSMVVTNIPPQGAPETRAYWATARSACRHQHPLKWKSFAVQAWAWLPWQAEHTTNDNAYMTTTTKVQRFNTIMDGVVHTVSPAMVSASSLFSCSNKRRSSSNRRSSLDNRKFSSFNRCSYRQQTSPHFSSSRFHTDRI
jgi:hypothetical protein